MAKIAHAPIFVTLKTAENLVTEISEIKDMEYLAVYNVGNIHIRR